MPTISVFIRKDDLPKWQALENKSEWLSERLNGPGVNGSRTSKGSAEPALNEGLASPGSITPDYLTTRADVGTITTTKPKKTKLCKHGSPKGECFHKESARMRCNI